MSLKEKLLKNSTIKETSLLTESKIFRRSDAIRTVVPMINVALSGETTGGLQRGMLVLAGPSRHFKTNFALLMASAFKKAHPNGVILFYDSEFGTPASYISSFDIPPEDIVHTPIVNIEQFKHDIVTQLDGLDRKDEVFILVDSLGNLASKKEVDDAIDGKSVADMTRAKAIKSLFRIITPYLTIKDIPAVVVNHTYMSLEMYSKPTVSGGTGVMLSADNVWILGRQQDKDDKELKGYHFIINIEKSRYVKEKSKIPITVAFEGGIQKYSGLFDLAVQGGYITKGKPGWYYRVDKTTGEVSEKGFREAEVTNSGKFWNSVLTETDFNQFLTDTYKLPTENMISEDTEETE